MKRFLLLSVFLLSLATSTFATKVTISSGVVDQYHGPFSPSACRLESDREFSDSTGVRVPAASGYNGFGQQFSCSVDGSGAITIATGTAYSTDNSSDPRARYTLAVYDTNGRLIRRLFAAKGLTVPHTPSPTTWEALRVASEATPVSPGPTYPTTSQVSSMIATAVPNASTTAIGVTKLSVAPISSTNPIAVGDNDPRLAAGIVPVATSEPVAPVRINAGGPAVGRWIPDTTIFDLGTLYDSHITFQAATPLLPLMPQNTAALEWLRFNATTMTATVGGFSPRSPRLLRIWSGDAGFGFQQSINVNGTQVQANYVLQTDAGGLGKIGAKEYTVYPDSDGVLTVAFIPHGGGSAAVNAIEILPLQAIGPRLAIIVGDSRTDPAGVAGVAFGDTWSYQLANDYDANMAQAPGSLASFVRGYDETFKWTFYNLAISGQDIPTMQTMVDNYVPSPIPAGYEKKVFLECGGINDILLYNRSAATIESEITALFADAKLSGMITGICTIPPSTGLTTPQLATLAAVNTWERANSLNLNFVVDLAGDIRLSDPTITTYFADGTHLTKLGNTVEKTLIKAAFDALQ